MRAVAYTGHVSQQNNSLSDTQPTQRGLLYVHITYNCNYIQVYLNNNCISTFPATSTEQCAATTVIDLSFNQITQITSDVFNHFNKLQELYLRHNPLSIQADSLMNALPPRLQVLDIRQTEIIMEDIRRLFQGELLIDRNEVQSSTSVAQNCFAFGSGLSPFIDCIDREHFKISCPQKCMNPRLLVIHIERRSKGRTYKVNCHQRNDVTEMDGSCSVNVDYDASEAGVYTISVMYSTQHIRGSPFTVCVGTDSDESSANEASTQTDAQTDCVFENPLDISLIATSGPHNAVSYSIFDCSNNIAY